MLWPCHPLSRWPAWCACRCWVLGAGMPTRGAMCVSGAHGHAPAPEPVAYLVAVPLLMASPEPVAGVPTRGPVAVLVLVCLPVGPCACWVPVGRWPVPWACCSWWPAPARSTTTISNTRPVASGLPGVCRCWRACPLLGAVLGSGVHAPWQVARLGFEGGAVLPPPFNGTPGPYGCPPDRTPCPLVCGVLAGLPLSQLPAWCACRVPVGGAVGRVPTWWPCWVLACLPVGPCACWVPVGVRPPPSQWPAWWVCHVRVGCPCATRSNTRPVAVLWLALVPVGRWPAWCACRCWWPTPEPVAGVPTRGPVVVLVLCAYPWAMCVLGARGQVAGAVGVLFLVASASPKPHHQIERPPVGVLVRPPLSRWPAWCSCRCWVGWCRWACHQTMCPQSAQVVPPKLGAHFPVACAQLHQIDATRPARLMLTRPALC